MPFDFKAYDEKCNGLTHEELQREWEHYTRLISGSATSTAVSGLAIPFTLGVSTIGVAMAAPAIHNARKKREIIEKHLNKLNATHHTRKRDVLGSMAVSGTIGVVTLGVSSLGAEHIATAGAEHGIQAVVANETAIKIASHAAMDGVGMAVEHKHTSHLKKKDAFKAFKKAGVFQAVQDAKAAEAGYAHENQQSYNGQQPYYGQPNPYAAGSSSQAPYVPPPPPYSATTGYAPAQPTYAANLGPNGYPVDFKTPAQPYLAPTDGTQQYGYSQQQVPSRSPSTAPPVNGQVPLPPQTPVPGYAPQPPASYSQTPAVNQQQYDYSQQQNPAQQQQVYPQQQQVYTQLQVPPQQQQQYPPPPPSAVPTVNASVYSPPETPAGGYPPQQVPASYSQTTSVNQQHYDYSQQQPPARAQPAVPPVDSQVSSPPQTPAVGYPPQSIPGAQGSAVPPYNPATPQPFNMSKMNEALPVAAPVPTHPYQRPQSQLFTNAAALPTPPQEPTQAYASGYQSTQPNVPNQAIQQQQTGYFPSVAATPAPTSYPPPPASVPPQPTPQPASQVPPPPPMDHNRRDSVMSTQQQPYSPQHSYNPQHYGPVSQQHQTYNPATYGTPNAPAQTPQPTQTHVQYAAPPQTPVAHNVNQYQQNGAWTNYSNQVPAAQPEKGYAPGAPWQNGQPAHQQHYYPQSAYPPTPVSLPYSPPPGH